MTAHDPTIPPEALEALAMAILDITGEGIDMDEARAACLAMLRNWPGVELDEAMWSGGRNFVILPLPKERERMSESDRHIKHGVHLFQLATSLGWTDGEDEGPIEFVMRRTREVALEDAQKVAKLDRLSLTARVKELEGALEKIEYLAQPQSRGKPGAAEAIHKITSAALTPVRTDSRFNNAERIFGDD